MSRRRLGCTGAVVTTLGATGLLAVTTWIPPAHPIHTPGARAVQAHIIYSWVPWRGRVPPPSISVDKVRCQAWPLSPSQPCPDAATLAQRLWPGVLETPATLYIPMASTDVPSGGTAGLNVEYNNSESTLTIHTYLSQALYALPLPRQETEGAALAPTVDLLVVSTAGTRSGTLKVWQDSWIERLVGDEANGEVSLGAVEIS